MAQLRHLETPLTMGPKILEQRTCFARLGLRGVIDPKTMLIPTWVTMPNLVTLSRTI